MARKRVVIDAELARTARVLALTSHCYRMDSCESKCPLYEMCLKNMPCGDMGRFRAWSDSDIREAMSAVHGCTEITYDGQIDRITPYGMTRERMPRERKGGQNT